MKLLIITSRFPYPLDKGDKLRAYYQIKELSKHNEIFLISTTEYDIKEQDINKLKIFCNEVIVYKLQKWKIAINLCLGIFSSNPFQIKYFYQRKIHNKIKKDISRIAPDHIFCQLIRSVLYVKDEHFYNKTLDYMDCLSEGIKRRIPFSKILKPILKIEYKRLKVFENLAFEYFNKHIIISENDRSYIYHEKRNDIKIVTNGIDSNFFKATECKKKYDIVFVGNLSYPPNVIASLYIINDLLPELQKTFPNISILISGANPHKSLQKLNKKPITILDWVDDIRKSYLSGKIFLAPMLNGTGLQNKLLEAMSLELPCITSELANKSLQAKNTKNILIARDKSEYIAHISHLLLNKEKAEVIGKNARKFILDNYNWYKSGDDLQGILSLNKDFD